MKNTDELQKEIEQTIKKLQEFQEKLSSGNIKDTSIPITDRIKDYNDILELSGVVESDDDVKVKGFNDSENNVVKACIKKIRIAKVYNEGWVPKRGERRWYPWYDVSSGFGFDCSCYVDANANAGSASRLCLKNESLMKDYVNKFKDIDEDFIDLR